MVTKDVLFIIPARGGSKRIPRKNIYPFRGKPMITYSIVAALEVQLEADVVVNTDSEEIAQVAVAAGAEVPFMRERYADDYTPISEVTADTVAKLTDEGRSYKTVVQLMANTPLRDSNDITRFLQHFQAEELSFLISCTKYNWLNPWWAYKTPQTPEQLFPEQAKMRSQDLPPLYCPTGAIWVAKAAELQRSRTFYGPGYQLLPLHWTSAVDIDDLDDLQFAEAIALYKEKALSLSAD